MCRDCDWADLVEGRIDWQDLLAIEEAEMPETHTHDTNGQITEETAESKDETIVWTIVHCSVCGEGVRRTIKSRTSK